MTWYRGYKHLLAGSVSSRGSLLSGSLLRIRLLQDRRNNALLLHAQVLYQASIVLGLFCLELCEVVSYD